MTNFEFGLICTGVVAVFMLPIVAIVMLPLFLYGSGKKDKP